MLTIRKLLIGRSALPGGGGCAASASPAGGVSGVAPSSRCRNVFPLESIRAAAVHPGQVGQFTIGDTAVPSANRVVEDAPRILAQNSLLEMLGEILRSLVSDVFRANLPGAAIPPQAPQDGPLCGFAPDLQRSSQASVRGTLMSGTGRSAPVSLRARRTSLLILRQGAGRTQCPRR